MVMVDDGKAPMTTWAIVMVVMVVVVLLPLVFIVVLYFRVIARVRIASHLLGMGPIS